MKPESDSHLEDEKVSTKAVLVTAAFVIVFTCCLYVLVHSMQKHHFFSGGQMNKHSQLHRPARERDKHEDLHVI
jgi:hypothetical protein